jgi:signal transduction histidine kinase
VEHVETPQEALDHLRLEVAALRASRRRLVENADDDRRSFERVLHESVQQQLVALAVTLQLVAERMDTDPASAKTLLEEMERDLQQALNEAAHLAERLYPPVDPGLLAPGLRAAAHGLGIRLSFEDTIASVPTELARTIFLCCLAALERAGAGARATIGMRRDETEVIFEIVDDGAGDTGPAVPLERLRDRVEALGGSLSVQSGPGGRARVACRLPYAR